MAKSYVDSQITQWNVEEIRDRLDYIRAHVDAGGKCSQGNAIEILTIAERALSLAIDVDEGF